MAELISRQKALEALGEEPPVWYNGEDEIAERDQWRRDVAAIEAVECAEPKTGEWIGDAETFYKAVNEYGGGVDENTPYFTDDIACSKCLAKFSVIDNETERFDFCPNCGARMRGADDE